MERSTVVQDISQQVTCGICLEHFKTPKTVIPCLHNFCEVCLQDMIASTAQPKIGNPPDSQFFTFSCPTCRGAIEFPVKLPQPWDMKQIARDAVKLEFKTNFQIENQLEIINKKIEKGCPQHRGEVRMWYCKACHKVICQFCVQEDHNSDKHTVTLLNEIANEKRKGLSSHKEVVETRLCELELTRAQMESQLEQIHSARSKYDHQKKKVTDEFLAIHKELDSLKSKVVTRAQGKDFDLLSSNEMVILAVFQEVLEQVDNYKAQLNEIDKRIADTDSDLVEQSSDSVTRMLEEFAAETPPNPPSVPKLEIPQIPEIPLDVLEHGMSEIKNILKNIADDLKLSPAATPKSGPSSRNRALLERWPQTERSCAEKAEDEKKDNQCLEVEESDLWHFSLFDEEDEDGYKHREQEEEEEWEAYQYQEEDKEDVESPWYSCHSSPIASSPLQELDSIGTSSTTAATTTSVNQQPPLPALGTGTSHGMNAQGASNNPALIPSSVQQGTVIPGQMLINPVNPQQIMYAQQSNVPRQQAVYMPMQANQRGNPLSGIPMNNMSQTLQGGQPQATYQQNPSMTMTAPTLISSSHHSRPQSAQYMMQPQMMMTQPNLYNPRQQMAQILYQRRPAFQPGFQQPQQPPFYQGSPPGSVYQQPNALPFYQGLPSSAVSQQTNSTPLYQGSPVVSAPGGALYPQTQAALVATQPPLLRQPVQAMTTSQVQHPTSTDATLTHPGGSSASSKTPFEPLTAHMLARTSQNEQKQMIGERLYPIIHKMHGDLSGKITGMLLEMDNAKLLHLLESRDALIAKVEEAVEVLQMHTRKV